MKSLIDRQGVLSRGLADIRTQFQVPPEFPPAVLAEADLAAARPASGHADWTDRDFVTLDPKSSTDLDQAFAIEQSGTDIVLHYAIADVAWFVGSGDALDLEAWVRGETIYMPDGKASLYPPSLSESAASLLADVDRPSVVFTVRIDPTGKSSLDSALRAMVRSRAKLAYETVTPADLPSGFTELFERIERAEDVRGAVRVDAPEQELVINTDGNFSLDFRPQLLSEQQNAAMSLAANLAIADVMLEHRTGLFRVMAEPDERSAWRLRHTAKALGLTWPKHETLKEFEDSLNASDPHQAAFMTAVRRTGPGASYAPYREGVVPWHSAMAATYAHATAPLRRLADRYVIEATLQIMAGQAVSAELIAAFEKLPEVMARAEGKASQVERAVLDLAEAVILGGREGSRFQAVVTDVDERGTRIQLSDPAVVVRIDGKGAMPGDTIFVELMSVDVPHRQVKFQRID
ncbi:MAG TPA: RNB domain-containing ribonuclease [Sphingomicrobium sp.]|jgi:VacB/RNase II family 3'-5' exoribonuclease|nr:RNB domain-containing ribonuclease [Sphingomicrobium sp.]